MLNAFLNFFHNNNLENELPSTKVISTNYLKVIYPTEIIEMEKPPFKQAQWYSESEYVSYLEQIQVLIDEFEQNGAIHSLEYNSFEDIEKNRAEQVFIDNFRNHFIDVAGCICVEKTITGQYRCISNGRHRLYVAKKYNLKLLVRVIQEAHLLQNAT